MRRWFVPVLIVAVLGFIPVAARAAVSNQAAAEKIAAGLAEKFPGYDISVSFHNGKVRLVGQVASRDMEARTIELVQKIPGVKVTDIENGLRIVPQNNTPSPVTSAPRPGIPMPLQGAVARQQGAQGGVEQVAAHGDPARLVQNAAGYAQMMPPYAAQRNAAPMPQPLNAVPQDASQPTQQQMMQMQAYHQQMIMQQQMMQGQPCPPQAMQQPPMPGQYNQPNMPSYAWPAYAAYPNYAEVCYPKQYSPKAWPYIGPFYPYPQAPLGWRKVALEWHDGWWWLDFDDGGCEGPFSPLFRQPQRYTY